MFVLPGTDSFYIEIRLLFQIFVHLTSLSTKIQWKLLKQTPSSEHS